MGYLINKQPMNGKIDYLELDPDGYTFNPKNSSKKFISVKSVNVIEPKMIENLLTTKFEKQFDKLANIILKYLYQDDDDDDESDFIIMLDEIERLKKLLEIKYQRFLTRQEYKDYVAKLTFLDIQVRNKLAMLDYQNNLDYMNTQGRSM